MKDLVPGGPIESDMSDPDGTHDKPLHLTGTSLSSAARFAAGERRPSAGGGPVAATRFSPGVRLSTLDVIVLVSGTAGAAALVSVEWWFGLVVGIPLAHFFLFCNVFRVARPLELLWASIFVVLAGATILWGVPGWWPTALGSVCVAALAIAVEMRKPSYHGVGWQRINPELPDWWEAHGTR